MLHSLIHIKFIKMGFTFQVCMYICAKLVNNNSLKNFKKKKMRFTVQPIFKTFFLAFDICRFCVVIRFFFPATTANDLRLRMISIPDLSTSYYFFNYLHS